MHLRSRRRTQDPVDRATGAGPDAAGPGRDEHTAQRRARAYAREKEVLLPLYALVRVLVTPALRVWFRLGVSGSEHIPADGAAIIAANHKSFLDPFFIGVATRRHVRYMAKIELFRGPFAWLLVRLGAFPVRRGEADADAVDTARAILHRGGVVVVFPEGTRVDEPDALGSPHHGAGRLALETGAPIIPAAIAGTSHLWLGPLPKPRRVRLAFLPPIEVAGLPPSQDAIAELIDRHVWPAVRSEYGKLLTSPGVIAAVLTAIGIGGGLVARRQRKAREAPRLLGRIEPRNVRRTETRRGPRGRLQALRARAHERER
jgi:1-acyl-sn-glycerol-3-phosphate acyltransferase